MNKNLCDNYPSLIIMIAPNSRARKGGSEGKVWKNLRV